MKNTAVEDFTRIREINVMRLKEGKEAGLKVVGKYCTYCPDELIIAAGAIPVGLCGTKEDPIAAAEEHLPRNLCPLIKSSYGFAISDTCPFFHFSNLIVGETTCDGKKKMFEIMQEIKPVHVMQLPYRQHTEEAFALWLEEMRLLRKRIEEEFDVSISDDNIWKAIELMNRENELAQAIADLNQADPPVMSGIELLTVLWSRGFNIDKNEVISMLSSLLAELKNKDPLKPGRPRVLLTGCPVGIGTEKIITLVEDGGGTVVALENCTGYKTLSLRALREQEDPLVALAQKYLQIPCSCMSPNDDRLTLLENMLRDFSADAVIDLTWQACHTYNIESYTIANLVKQKQIPFLQLETDYSTSDLESLKVRIEALLEMV